MAGTRQQLMQALLHHKEAGLTIEELSASLGISRNAVQQHLTGLERDGLVGFLTQRNTGGRPSRAYTLSEKGYETFPRNYAMLAQTMLETAHATLGEEAVEKLLMRMADDLAEEMKPRLSRTTAGGRLEAVVEVMNELGYEATALPGGTGISAVNCIYHKLAEHTRAVCRYDVRLLSLMSGEGIDHTSCMADGQTQCVFRFANHQQRLQANL